jgi:hypothetical protein
MECTKNGSHVSNDVFEAVCLHGRFMLIYMKSLKMYFKVQCIMLWSVWSELRK